MERAISNEASGRTLHDIMAQLDAWVSRHGNGQYERGDVTPMEDFMIPDESAIQQNREEIKAFASVLLERGHLRSALEIGLGYFGSTHFLWRMLFDKVITIEKSHERVRAFGRNMRTFYQRWVLDDHRSAFLIGMSNDTQTVHKAYQYVQTGVDLLFIDGDHGYASVLTDWLLYSPLVTKGGIVAFHDVGLAGEGPYGVRQFVNQLERGEIDGERRDMQTILCGTNLGIGYYRTS